MNCCTEVEDGPILSRVGPRHCAFLMVLLMLPGCGLWGYFSSGDDEPSELVSAEGVSQQGPLKRDRIDDGSDLIQLESYLLRRSPALVLLRNQLQGEVAADRDEAWIPGARFVDSAATDQHRADARVVGDRSISIDWRPATLFEGEFRNQQLRSRGVIASARLRESRSKMLRLLREEWSQLWFHHGAIDLTNRAIESLDLDSIARSSAPSIQLESLRSRWSDRLDGTQQQLGRTVTRINSLLGRSPLSSLPRPVDAGDGRFIDVDLLPVGRLHPREILAAEDLALASSRLEQASGSDWPEIVVGARSNYDGDAPIAGSAGHEESWTVTLGVEFPLGLNTADQRRREAIDGHGSARARQVLARRSIEDEIAVARAQLFACIQTIDELEQQVIPRIEEAAANLAGVPVTNREEARLRILERLFDARVGLLRSVSDRARARVSLVDLLGIEHPGARGMLSRSR
jgi:hypothetical protein